MYRYIRWTVVVFWVVVCIPALAQQPAQKLIEIKGLVQAKDGSPVPGATIRIKGSGYATSADANGRFVIKAIPGDTLMVVSIGFTRLEVPCKATPMMRLVLQDDQQQLNQVVVVGYGRERKRNITGSITSISAKDISQSSAISFDNAIIGKAPGVHVISSSGVPGSATGITIRGISTLNADGNQPLIVIDGIPVYGSGRDLNTSTFRASTTPAIGFGGTSVSDNLSVRSDFESNPLAYLNPNDIESIEILKDAYATAIYGSRGAAGVILITTKKGGTGGRPAFNARYMTGTVQPIGEYAVLNGQEYADVYTEYYKQLGRNATFEPLYDTDWMDAVTRTDISHTMDVSMSASGDKAQYYVSGSYLNQPSYIKKNDYHRYTGRMNLVYKASERFSLGSNMSVAYTENTALNAAAIYREALMKAPNLPIREENGLYAYGKGTNTYGNMDSNPVADLTRNTNKLESAQTLGNIYAQYSPLSWLTLRSELGVEFNKGNTFTRRAKRPSGFGDDAVESNADNRKMVINNTISILHSTDNGHYVNAVLGQSFERSTESITSIGGYGFFSDDVNSINAAEDTYITSSLKQQWALVSYFGRVNYEYNQRYLAGVTYRIDGSSKFSRNKRHVGFPSFSVGWRLSEESFLKPVEWIDDVKIRGSVGFSGNNSPFSYYGNQGQYTINSNGLSYAGTPILEMQQPDNPNLKWERTRALDIGLDATLWNNRFSIVIDYYDRRINDMILSSAIPLYQGWGSQPQNIGKMTNQGIEIDIDAQPIRKPDFDWHVQLNVSRNTNKLLQLNFEGESIGLANDAYKYMKVGEPIAQFYLYDWAGIDPYTGDPLWRYGAGDVRTVPPASQFAVVDDVNDFRRLYGSSFPDLFGGLGNTFRYKNWELNAFCSFSLGGKMINGSRAILLTYATEEAHNLSRDILNHWQIPGQQTDVPRLVNSSITAPQGSASSVRDFTTSRTNSRFLEDASYLRLRTIDISYRIPHAVLQQISHQALRSLQVFVRGSNLFTWTKYQGVDPEVNAFGSSAIHAGYDELTMPQNKMIQIGVNVGL